MAEEDRQSDKMALTALLVVILFRKIRRRSLGAERHGPENGFEKSATRGIPKCFT